MIHNNQIYSFFLYQKDIFHFVFIFILISSSRMQVMPVMRITWVAFYRVFSNLFVI